jgi:hypothetical protein
VRSKYHHIILPYWAVDADIRTAAWHAVPSIGNIIHHTLWCARISMKETFWPIIAHHDMSEINVSIQIIINSWCIIVLYFWYHARRYTVLIEQRLTSGDCIDNVVWAPARSFPHVWDAYRTCALGKGWPTIRLRHYCLRIVLGTQNCSHYHARMKIWALFIGPTVTFGLQ